MSTKGGNLAGEQRHGKLGAYATRYGKKNSGTGKQTKHHVLGRVPPNPTAKEDGDIQPGSGPR